jgi:Apea-like HEPN
MDGQQRRSLDVALDRLNLARRRRSPGDKAIDAGICLEALLGDDSPQELTYKLRLRAALLLGTTLDERRKIRDDVRDLYDLRSSVVHGRVRRPKDTLLDGQHASRGLEICTQAVRAIVQRNARPDFAAWELTGGPPDNKGFRPDEPVIS